MYSQLIQELWCFIHLAEIIFKIKNKKITKSSAELLFFKKIIILAKNAEFKVW